jgi:hypothetical protein
MESVTVALIGGAVALAALAVVAHRRRTWSAGGAGRSGSGRRSSAPSERPNGAGSGETTGQSPADSGSAPDERGRDRTTGGSGLTADVERQLSADAPGSSGGSSATATRPGSTARGTSGATDDDAGSLDDIWAASSSDGDPSTDPDDLLDADEALEGDWRQTGGDDADDGTPFESSGSEGYRARTDRDGDPDDDLDSVFS